LKAGVVAPKTINLEARKLRDETAQEFIDWMEDLAIEHEKDYNKSDLFKKFGVVNDDGRVTKSGFNWLKQRDFTKWLKLWVQYRPEMAGYRESRSSGESFIQFFYNAPVRASNLESVAKNTRVVLFKDKCSGVVAVPEVEASQPEIIMNPTKINEEDNPF
jgi:hypothetical protein